MGFLNSSSNRHVSASSNLDNLWGKEDGVLQSYCPN